MKRSAYVQWRGSLRQGEGVLSTESGSVSNASYSFSKRFENERGTNPEELIGAAHAGCFSMAFSGELDRINLKAELIEVKADVFLEKKGEAWSIPAVHLKVKATVPGASYSEVNEAALLAKQNCPVSRLLRANVTMDFELAEEEEQQAIW